MISQNAKAGEDMEIGQRIKALREEKRMTQIDLAKVLKINNSTLSQYETGARIPSDDMKIAIADYFSVSLDYLLGRNEEKASAPEDGDGRNINIIKIAGRDGSRMERRLTDEQVAALKLMIDQLPDADNL